MAYEDLLKDSSKPDPDNKDYFLLTVTDLDPGKTYPIQLRWVYKNDKAAEDQEWSAVKSLITPAETINAPRFLSSDLSADGFNLVVKWTGKDYLGNSYDENLDRIEIFITGGKYGGTSTYSGRSFKSAGTETFAVNTSDTYYVKLRAVSKRNVYSSFSSEHAVITVAPLVVDTQGPSNVTSVTTVGGIDTSGYLGFNAYADISWPAVSDTTLRGYRIRFSNDNGTTYSYVDSPGTGTKYRLGGLAIGSTYKVAVATYDELNNTSSSYVSGADVTVTGTPSVSNYITGGPFQFGVGVGGVSTNKGLYFDASNYWYVNASNSARLKVGGSSSNYLLWDGSTFSIDGNITARGGSFSGNVAMTTVGASIYNGTLDGSGVLTGTGFILNKDGLQFKVDGDIKIGLETSGTNAGRLYARNADISGTITASTFTSPLFSSGNGIEISSSGGYDQIEMQAGSNQKLRLSANSSGAVIWGPDLTNYIAMPNLGTIQFNVTAPSGSPAISRGPSMTLKTGGVVDLTWPFATQTASTGVDLINMSLRNIGGNTYAPTLTSGAAFANGFYNGDIWLVVP